MVAAQHYTELGGGGRKEGEKSQVLGAFLQSSASGGLWTDALCNYELTSHYFINQRHERRPNLNISSHL